MSLGETGTGERVLEKYDSRLIRQDVLEELHQNGKDLLSQSKTLFSAAVFLIISSVPAYSQESGEDILLERDNLFITEPYDIFYLHDKYSYIIAREGFEIPEKFQSFTIRFWKVLEFFDRYNLTAEDILVSYDMYISWEKGDISQEDFNSIYDFLWASFPLLSQEEFDALMLQAGIIKSDYSLKV